jgi:hypothetical protein
MKSFSRTITALAIFSLLMGTVGLAVQARQGNTSTHTISGNVGPQGVVMHGLPGDPVSDENGNYEGVVERGWSGTVTPAKEGYKFNPPARVYENVLRGWTNEDYTATLLTFKISGTTGLAGVLMNGLPGNIVTDPSGRYSATVEYGWSGTVVARKEGHLFTPRFRKYTHLSCDHTNQNYAPEVQMLTISDVITIGGQPVQGVRVSADNIGVSDVTDTEGRYILEVPYGWSGEVTLSKEGYQFDPAGRLFTKVTRDIVGADTRRAGRGISRASRRTTPPAPPTYVPPFAQAGQRRALIVPTGEIKQEELFEVEQDMRVMAHILDKRFREPRLIRGMFEDYGDFFGRDSRDTEAIYIQGYGVLFLMEVNLPFSRTLGPDQKQVEAREEPIDTAWEKAKREVSLSTDLGSRRPDRADKSDAERVEDFKTELIEALKHAANIRNLKSDEWIIVTVIGGALPPYGFVEYGGPISSVPPLPQNPQPGQTASAESGFEAGARAGGYGMAGSSGYGGVVSGGYGGFGGGFSSGFGGGYGMGGYGGYGGRYLGMPSPSSAVLIIRVKKANVDAFAKGNMDFDEFQQRVAVFTYPDLSGKVVSERISEEDVQRR